MIPFVQLDASRRGIPQQVGQQKLFSQGVASTTHDIDISRNLRRPLIPPHLRLM